MENKKTVVVLFNGAPASGKDTSAEYLQKAFGFGEIVAFKDVLYEDTAKQFGMDFKEFKELATNRATKEKPNRNLIVAGSGALGALKRLVGMFVPSMWKTPRQALIYTSEEVIKPKYGNSVYGNKVSHRIKCLSEEGVELVLIPDSGFIDELKPLVEDGYNILVVRIHREEHTFEGDSRKMLTDEELLELGVQFVDIHNNGTLEDFEENLLMLAVSDVSRML